MALAKILFIDDNSALRLSLSARLRSSGYDVTAVGSGQDGLNATKSQSFDLILLDMLMPQQDGITTYQAFRAVEATRNVPVILFTAMAVEGHWEQLQDDVGGLCFVMGKPYDLSLLLGRISQLLNGSQEAS